RSFRGELLPVPQLSPCRPPVPTRADAHLGGERMASLIGTVLEAVAARHKAWRRARNLRSGARAAPRRAGAASDVTQPAAAAGPTAQRDRGPAAVRWIGAAGVLAALGGAALIAGHARHLAVAAEPAVGSIHIA